MKIGFLITIIFLSLGMFSQVKSDVKFKASDFSTHYFAGQKCKEKHTLTFLTDTTFHITVPNNSRSCFGWDESGGEMKINGDTIIFTLTGIYQGRQVFIIKDSNTIEKITVDGFMCKTYKLKEWSYK